MSTTSNSTGAGTLRHDEPCEALEAFLEGLTPAEHSELAPLIPNGGKDDGYKLGLAMDWIEDHGGDREWAEHLTTDHTSDRAGRVLRKKVIEGYHGYVCPRVDNLIYIDRWLQYAMMLHEGDDFSTFRVATQSGGPIKSLAVEIEITGRTIQRYYGRGVVRVKVVFPGDGEPDTVTRGWLVL